jgi:hypothetical protein
VRRKAAPNASPSALSRTKAFIGAARRHRVAPALLGERAGQGIGSRNGPGESGRARNALAASVIGLFEAEQMLMS